AGMSSDGVDEILDKHIVGKCNIEEVRLLAGIGHKCLHKTPRRRPSIADVSQAISKIRRRRLTKEDTMSFAGGDVHEVLRRIENQHVELSSITSMKERVQA
ncbi:hypothetical protein MKW94_022906, partial [Papaver nudicaule]|nr:hypothetical protein [Papaver nudicaule]